MVTIPAVAGVKGSQLFDDDGTLVTTLESGASVLVRGRSADSSWLSVTSDGGDGWMQARQLIIYGLSRLSVAETPAAVVAAAGNLASRSGFCRRFFDNNGDWHPYSCHSLARCCDG